MDLIQPIKKPQSNIYDEGGTLKIVIPKKINWITIILFFGLLLYLFNKFINIPNLLSNYFAIVLGMTSLTMIGYLILLSSGGTEEISINSKHLIKTRKFFGVNFLFGQRFDLFYVKNLRYVHKFFWPLPEYIGINKDRKFYGDSFPYDPSTILEGFGIGYSSSIFFEYGCRIIRLGGGLDDEELKYLTNLIKEKYPILKIESEVKDNSNP